MLNRYAWYFFVLAQLFERLHKELGLPPPASLLPPPSAGISNALNPLASAFAPVPMAAPSNEISQDHKARLLPLLEIIGRICGEISIHQIENDIKRATNYLNGQYLDRQRVIFHIETITNHVIDEIHGEQFLHVPSNRAPYYENIDLFGEDVNKKFQKISEDIHNAGRCYAVSQYTACVFHLMRIMEHCVQRFGKKLKVPINVEKETWYKIMQEVPMARLR